MSRDMLTVGFTMRIPLLYRGEYSQLVERFMNYLEKQTDGEAMINSIKNGDQPLPRVTQVSIAGTSSTEQPNLKDKSMGSDQEKRIQKIDCLARSLLIQGLSNDIYSLIDSNKTAKDLWDALNMDKNLMDINIDTLYNILKQNQGDVNDAMGSKKKTVVVTSDPLALIAEKTKVIKSKEKVVVSSDSEGSEADDFSELKKVTDLLAKAFNRKNFYSKPTNNNLRTSSTSQSANKKQEFFKTDNKIVEKKDDEKKRDMSRVKCYNCKKEGYFAKDCKKVKVKDYEYYKTKMLLAKKDKDEQVFLAEDQAWMESSSNSDQEINVNTVFMAQIKKVISDSKASSSSADEKISEVSYYLSESESESEFETLEYYDNSTNYGLFVNNDDDQEIFHYAIESASENFIENHIDSQKDYDKSDVNHNDSEEKYYLVDKLIRKFNKKIVKWQKSIKKRNQQSKDFENQNKDLQDKYDVLKNQATIFEINNKELNEQLKELIEMNNDLLTQTKVLKEQLQVKHFMIDTHAEC
nr:retrovirus-related Pol polyprotein from transposon TNT 1-94 [Tanacetum cinerariifolium]